MSSREFDQRRGGMTSGEIWYLEGFMPPHQRQKKRREREGISRAMTGPEITILVCGETPMDLRRVQKVPSTVGAETGGTRSYLDPINLTDIRTAEPTMKLQIENIRTINKN